MINGFHKYNQKWDTMRESVMLPFLFPLILRVNILKCAINISVIILAIVLFCHTNIELHDTMQCEEENMSHAV